MIGLDASTLAAAMLGCPLTRAQVWAPHLDAAMLTFEINSPQRAADFIAQVGHESLGLLYAAELWGPAQVPAQVTYERDFSQPWGPTLKRGDRNYKAYRLGNSERGDGRRFAGHGPIQVTGRANHAQARDDLRTILGPLVPDFEFEPLALTQPRWGSMAAGNFWRRNGLNVLADQGKFLDQSVRINGANPPNGWLDRQTRRNRARIALGLAA